MQKENWRHRDPISQGQQDLDVDLLKDDAVQALEEELRLETDQMARGELDLLKTVRFPFFYWFSVI